MAQASQLCAEVDRLSARYLASYRAIESEADRIETEPDRMTRDRRTAQLYERLVAVSHRQAAELRQLLDIGGFHELAVAFIRTPLHADVLMRSAFLHRALGKPRGYPGDIELLRMICEPDMSPETLFAQLVNRVYLDLPACDAVRQRVRLLQNFLDQLPPDSLVLSVVCGPALEVQRHLATSPRGCRVHLLDNDVGALEYLQEHISGKHVEFLHGNVTKLMSGDRRVTQIMPPAHATDAPAPLTLTPSYNLIYSSGLFDYIPTANSTRIGSRRLIQELFELLVPGGRLVIGNFLKPALRNPHLEEHRLILELYSRWRLIYRSPSEIGDLAAGIPADDYLLDLFDEYGNPLGNSSSHGAIGFLSLTKRDDRDDGSRACPVDQVLGL